MTIGTEHEYSINNADFVIQPVSDEILKEICGCYQSDTPFKYTILGKELQKTVIEISPQYPASNISILESQLVSGIDEFNKRFGDRYKLLGLGMHPTATLQEISVWDHDEVEIYEAYNRLFNLRQHGWLNIQALQINISYFNEKDIVDKYNKIRSLLPYLIAITASSPMVEGRMTGICDNRLVYYRNNQKEIPEICDRIIPKKIKTISDYNHAQKEVYNRLQSHNAEILCGEWVNSSGLIIRPSRNCLEIKALDEQECIHSDMAVCAFIRALMRYPTWDFLENDQEVLLDMTEEAIRYGTIPFRNELEDLLDKAWSCTTDSEKLYFPNIGNRIMNGSIAERMRARSNEDIKVVLGEMAESLRTNIPYSGDDK
jgi:gamma-glutamyl:cysteine ligase YbdK (ATP-grasp superfamily)